MKFSKFLLFYFISIPFSWAQPFSVLFESGDGEAACYRIPAITVASNGDILVAVDERVPSCADLRGSDDINIVLKRSADKGESWTAKEIVLDFKKGISASDPSFIVDKLTNEIFLFYNYMDLVNEPNVYYFQYVNSKDNGLSWSDPVDITSQISKTEWHQDFKFITSGQGVQTADGRLLHTLVHLEKGAFVFGSEDHGETWQIFGNPAYPGDESKIIAFSDSRWMVNSRVNKAGFRYVHISSDEGETWDTRIDSMLTDPSCNAGILKYSDEILYFSNANHPTDRTNLTLKRSTNSGKTWDKIDLIYPDLAAYSDIVMLENDHIGVVFEKDDYKTIVFAKVKIESNRQK